MLTPSPPPADDAGVIDNDVVGNCGVRFSATAERVAVLQACDVLFLRRYRRDKTACFLLNEPKRRRAIICVRPPRRGAEGTTGGRRRRGGKGEEGKERAAAGDAASVARRARRHTDTVPRASTKKRFTTRRGATSAASRRRAGAAAQISTDVRPRQNLVPPSLHCASTTDTGARADCVSTCRPQGWVLAVRTRVVCKCNKSSLARPTALNAK